MRIFSILVFLIFSLFCDAKPVMEKAKQSKQQIKHTYTIKSHSFKRKSSRAKFKVIKLNYNNSSEIDALDEEFSEDVEHFSFIFCTNVNTKFHKKLFNVEINFSPFKNRIPEDIYMSFKLPPKI